MDSVTQLVLGAAVGEAALGRKVGRRAMLWGAVCGTIPDLDVFIPLGDPVRDFTYHRSFSHSLIVLAALTPLVVWLILKLHPDTRPYKHRWAVTVYLVFATHVLLDCFTAYGTQILWPLITTPVAWSTIFIIDPLYTLPLLVGVVAALCLTRTFSRGHRVNTIGLVLSSAYLAWTVAAKIHVDQIFRDALTGDSDAPTRLFTAAGPFNTVLWRAVAMADDGYRVGYYSLLDRKTDIDWERYPSREDVLVDLAGHFPVERLRWFSKGFYEVAVEGSDVVMSDLRMGLEPDYVFRFIVGEVSNPHVRATAPVAVESTRDWSRLKWVWARLKGLDG